ncbi:MAG: hypothetical protein WCS96_07830 [Victivallales bacterium]
MEENMAVKSRNIVQSQRKTDKWKHTFAYFWYDEPHIFEWGQSDFDRAMKKYSDTGINHIIGFSITHFRWSFYPWWDIINRTIGKIVLACHKNNIFYTEHHSASLHFCLDTPERLAFAEKRVFGKRKGSYHNWPDFQEKCLGNIIIDGKNLKDMFQIDIASRKPHYIDEWGANILCPNNPDFIHVYLKYLESLYKLGIDGIMTDDILFYGSSSDEIRLCSCCYCQEKYKRLTGYQLPSSDAEFEEFQKRTNLLAYIAIIRFREESVRGFHVKVKEHYESLGLNPFRPNYSATEIYWSNPWQYCFDRLPALDWVMIENTYEHIIRYSWPEWLLEHNHRFALARYRRIPAAAMFYPHAKDQVEFCWALAMTSGIQYLGTANCKPLDLNPWEKPLRKFEQEHQASMQHADKLARVAFYFSRSTRDLYSEYEGRTRENITSWMFACELGNVPYDLILPEELGELSRFNIIILNEAFVMSDAELDKIKRFVESGGKIIWAGENAAKDENFQITRTFFDIWGFERPSSWNSYGKGQIYAINLEDWTGPLRRRVLGPLHMIKDDEPNYDYKSPGAVELALYRKISGFISDALTEADMTLQNAPDGLLCHLFAAEKRDHLVFHVLNAAGTLDKPEIGYVMHRDPLPFPMLGETMTVKIRKPDGMRFDSDCEARLFVPTEPDRKLELSDSGKHLQFELPLKFIRFYGLVTIGEILN